MIDGPGERGDLKANFQKLRLSQPQSNSIWLGIHSSPILAYMRVQSGEKKKVSDSNPIYMNSEKEELYAKRVGEEEG